MNKALYHFNDTPSNEIYCNILEYAIRDYRYLLLVIRDTIQLSCQGNAVLERLSPYIYKIERASVWPGTQLFDNIATVYKYHYVKDCVNIFKDTAKNFYEWQQPKLPEDICILRDDETPWLITIAHEKEVYFNITSTEYIKLLNAIPAINSFLVKNGIIK